MENFIKPRYDAGGFAGLPQRIRDSLTGPEKYDAVVLFLIDGFGWRFFEKFQQESFLRSIAHLGRVEKLTSQFPSTTAAHLTTLHTGLPVGAHGVFEWTYYEPSLAALIQPLLFSHGGTRERDTLKQIGARPRRIFPTATFYQSLKKMGIPTTIYQHREITPSSYGDVLMAGARVTGYKTLPEALVTLAEDLTRSNQPGYYMLYNDKVDAISHEYGPDSSQTAAEIQMLLLTMETIFQKAMALSHKKILCLLTADHGQSETDPGTTIYLNRDPRFKGFEAFLRTDQHGQPIIPAGSPRDFFLYIRPGRLDEALDYLAPRLEGQAKVRKVTDLAAEGYFGPLVSPKFRLRAGDLVILPHRYESVWWYEKDHYEQKYYGHHGGLTAQEMEIPLLIWEL